MKKRNVSLSIKFAFVVFGLCLCLTSPVLAATTVYYDNLGELDGLIGGVEFFILSPNETDISNFDATIPNGWLNMSSGNKFSAFDMGGNSGLTGEGILGSFNIDVILGDWELGSQAGEVIPAELYNIVQSGTDYTITRAPIPSALLLLGGGLVGLLGIRRKTMRS